MSRSIVGVRIRLISLDKKDTWKWDWARLPFQDRREYIHVVFGRNILFLTILKRKILPIPWHSLHTLIYLTLEILY